MTELDRGDGMRSKDKVKKKKKVSNWDEAGEGKVRNWEELDWVRWQWPG